VSLSAQEQQVLDLIKDGLAGSDSGLAALLGTFNRLASGEEMPAREKIRPGSREAAGCAGRGRRHPHRDCRYPHRDCRYPRQAHRRLGQWGPPLLWLLITLSLIIFALVAGRGASPGKCPSSLGMACSHPGIARGLYPALGNRS
jgi:hypothetical protein